jgi:hypothetical protein
MIGGEFQQVSDHRQLPDHEKWRPVYTAADRDQSPPGACFTEPQRALAVCRCTLWYSIQADLP